jgi:tripartite-type tricarboxylate transporter receptor subunit TctC
VLLVVPQGNLTINPTLLARPGYSVETDFAPVASLAKAAIVIAVHPGVPGIAISSWYGVMAPRKTPPAVLKQLEKDIQEIFNTPAVVKQLDLQGIEPWVVTGSAFGELIRKETATWVPVIKAANVTPQ